MVDLLRQRWRLLAVHNPLERLGHRHLVLPQVRPGGLCSDHLDHGAAQAPDVGSSAGLELHDLGSHPVDAAVDGPEAAGDSVLQGLKLTAGTKVCKLGIALRVNQDVCTLDITVHNPLVVKEVQTLQDLPGVLPHQANSVGSELVEHPLDRAAWHELQEDQECGVLLFVLSDAAVVPHNPGVPQALQCVDLQEEGANLLLCSLAVEAHV
mmetsp:Transcript_55557/g.125254  ORF Transcript_55557/g.125254 Transcript_55557/m.125254 type:complete len:209 (-) Transcript_55557:267-893(-)